MYIDTDARMDGTRVLGQMIATIEMGAHISGSQDVNLDQLLLTEGFNRADIDRYLAHALVILKELHSEGVMAKPPISVAIMTEDDACPGLWIGFKNKTDRAAAAELFRVDGA